MPVKQKEKLTIVIDFDSTFTKVEGLDELARIASPLILSRPKS